MKKNHPYIAVVLAIVFPLFFLTVPGVASAATPELSSITTNLPDGSSLGLYRKFEVTFQINKNFNNTADNQATDYYLLPYYYYDAADTPSSDPGRNSPYGVNGISIDVHFTSPSGKQATVPAFYYQDYVRSQNGSDEVMMVTDNYSWKIRFAPQETGTYNYYLTVTDREGSTRYPSSGTFSFPVSSSADRGFIRVSKEDPRMLAFDGGESFIPVGSGRQWWKCCGTRSFDYEKAFADFNQNGINFTRIWDQNDGYALTVEGHFDAYKYPDDYNPEGRVDLGTITQGTQFNQRGNFEEDKIIEAAQRNGVYIELSSHGDPYWIWDAANLPLSDKRHLNYWKRNFRYRVARWGYSTAILSWEHWNEMGHIVAGTDTYNFYQTYAEFQKATDPYGHLRTTSQGSQAYSPGFWSSGAADLANYHDYMMSSRYPAALFDDEVNFVAGFSWCLGTKGAYCAGLGLGDGSSWSGNFKPWIWGEIDVGTANWNEVNPAVKSGEARIRMLHNTAWTGLFTPMATSPLDWYWDQEDASTTTARYTDRKAISAFFKGMDYAGAKFAYMTSAGDKPAGYTGETVTSSNTAARVYAMRRSDKKAAYLWVQNRNHVWSNTGTPSGITTEVTIGNLLNENYTVEIWNTSTGLISSSSVQTPSSGNIKVTVNNLSDDAAVKIVSTSLPAATVTSPPLPTSTPASPSVTPTPVIGDGHVKNYGTTIDFNDILELLKNWLNQPTSYTDQYRDGKVNALDYAVVVYRMQNQPTVTLTPSSTPVSGVTLTPTRGPSATPYPTLPSSQVSGWSQFGHDSQRTNYTADYVPAPWKYKWQWNGADGSGKTQVNHLAVPDLVQPVTGGNKVYMVAADSVYALDKTTGNVVWTRGGIGILNSTPAYDNGFLYIGSGDGKVYKLDAASGSIASSFNTGSAIETAVLLANNTLYTGNSGGKFYALDPSNLSQKWIYSYTTALPGGAEIVTPAAFSSAKSTLVFVTKDLMVHTLDAATGTKKWEIKPTNRNYECVSTSGDGCNVTTTNGAQAQNGWPVIAESHGIVFIRYRIERETWLQYPNTNSEIKQYLADNPGQQILYALSLENGQKVFTPAVGNSGAGDGDYLPMGTQPVVKNVNGQEVVYLIWRNAQTCGGCLTSGTCSTGNQWCDGREDAVLGEMVLDNSVAITGCANIGNNNCSAGDLRFIGDGVYRNPPTDIQTDEAMQLTMSGDMLFHNHWMLSQNNRITDRGNGLGNSFTNPVKTVPAPDIIWRQTSGQGCTFNSATRYCNTLYSYADTRSYNTPGFYEYFDAQNGGSTPFTIVSSGQVLVKTADGGLMALENGTSAGAALQSNLTVSALIPRVGNMQVLAAETETHPYSDALKYLGKTETFTGTIKSAVNRRPKAIYLGFTDPHDGALLVRIFEKDLSKWNYDPMSLLGKKIEVTGLVTLYWPENKDPEIIVTDPEQIKIF